MPRAELDVPVTGIPSHDCHSQLRKSVKNRIAEWLKDSKWDLKPEQIGLAKHTYTADSDPAAVVTVKVYYHPTEERTANLKDRFDGMTASIAADNPWLTDLRKEGQLAMEVIGVEIDEEAWSLA